MQTATNRIGAALPVMLMAYFIAFVFVIAWPGAGVIPLLWMIGVYAIVFGVVLVILAVRLRAVHGRRMAA